ncbi:MAG: chemotaxis protein CheW [Gemmatimonadota bacterium]|nr:chemotaxis protein CheW [Gemmatimonadota bacterium]
MAGGRRCACPLEVVREIVPMRSATRLPGAPEWVRGLVNLRGALVTVADLSARFGAPSFGAIGDVLVADALGKTIGILVDSVKDVLTLEAGQLEVVEGEHSVGGVVSHVAYAGNDQVLVCDVQAFAQQVLVY